MDDKNGKNQMDLFSFFEDGKPEEDQNQDNKTHEDQDELDVLDFNTGEDTGEAPNSGEGTSQTKGQTLLIPMPTVPAGMPVFEYAGASEPIKNLQITFEDLRKEKSKDFSELEKKEKVTWTVDYGIFKTVNDTGKTIAQVKTEIEGSKEFLDALKKSRKSIICKVKPRVSGQTKGVASAYKGVFTNLEDAAKAKKVISILPSRDAKLEAIGANDKLPDMLHELSSMLAECMNALAYGVGLDEIRMEEARKRLYRIGKGSFFHSRISSEAFHLLFLNPPYMVTYNPNGFNVRDEKKFLVEALSCLKQEGILVYIFPTTALHPTSAGFSATTSGTSVYTVSPARSSSGSSRSQ